MDDDRRAERFGAVLSLLYEFKWPMSEAEILQRSLSSSDAEELPSLLSDLKRAELISDLVPGSWKLTKKGNQLVRKSLG